MPIIGVIKGLHVTFVLAAIAVAVGGGALPALIARSGDVRAIRVAFRTWLRYADVIAPLGAIGGILGVATAWAGHFDLTRPWLLISYGLAVSAFVFGGLIDARWHGRVLTAAIASPDDHPSPELEALLRSRPPGFWMLAAVSIALVFDMVVKPLG